MQDGKKENDLQKSVVRLLDLQKVVLPHRQKCRRIIPGIPRIGIQVIALDIGLKNILKTIGSKHDRLMQYRCRYRLSLYFIYLPLFLSYRPASSAVPQDKFSHFLNTVLTLRIHPCIVKIGVAKSFIQYHLNLYTPVLQRAGSRLFTTI